MGSFAIVDALTESSLRKAGTHTPCPIEKKQRMGPGFVSAFTRVFDALGAGTTQRVKAPILLLVNNGAGVTPIS